VMEVVGQHFRPEFINRIDDTIVFKPLTKPQIQEIAKIQLNRLRQRLVEREIDIEISDDALAYLAEAGFDPIYGARPLKRAIQQHLEDALAKDLLKGEYLAGDIIKVDLQKDQLSFSKG
jgi:ATP-dependent Clp protease ATP-binding subunit ClpB